MTGRDKALAILEGDRFDTPALYAGITSDALVEDLTGSKLERQTGLEVLGKAYRGHVDAVRIFFETIEPYWDEGEHTDALGFTHRTERWTEWIEKRPYSNVEEMATFIRDEIDRFRAWKPTGAEDERVARCDRVDEVLFPEVLLMGRCVLGSAPGSYFRDGLDNFSYLLAEYPELVQQWLDARHQVIHRCVKISCGIQDSLV